MFLFSTLAYRIIGHEVISLSFVLGFMLWTDLNDTCEFALYCCTINCQPLSFHSPNVTGRKTLRYWSEKWTGNGNSTVWVTEECSVCMKTIVRGVQEKDFYLMSFLPNTRKHTHTQSHSRAREVIDEGYALSYGIWTLEEVKRSWASETKRRHITAAWKWDVLGQTNSTCVCFTFSSDRLNF